jgi:hypothetical protein
MLTQARITQTVVLSDILFPLTLSEILTTIEKLGFEVNPTIPYPYPEGRFIGVGELGKKGKSVFQLNGGDRSFSIIDDSIKSGLENLNEFIKSIKEISKLDVYEHVKFYQMAANYNHYTENNPYEKIGLYCKSKNIESLSKLFKEDIQCFSIRISPSKNIPNSVNWFDITLTPNIERNNGYRIEVIYRNENKKIFEQFRDSIESKLIDMVKSIEGL